MRSVGTSSRRSERPGQAERIWVFHAAVVFAAVLLILITEATTSVMKRLIQAYHIKLSYQATLDSF